MFLLNDIRAENGVATVLCTLVFCSIFMFTAVFVDYARIAMFKVKLEQIAHAGLRSVLSAYDVSIQQKYGLFCCSNFGRDDIFAKVLNGSFETKYNSHLFSLLDYKSDYSSLKWKRSLGQHPIFKREICEQMKYIAPVQFALHILPSFKPIALQLKQASRTIRDMKDVEKIYEKRERKIDDVISHQRKASSCMMSLVKINGNRGSNIPYNNEPSAYQRVKQRHAMTNINQCCLQDTKQKYEHKKNDLVGEIEDAILQHSYFLNEARLLINQAQQLNNQIKHILSEGKEGVQNVDLGYTKIAQADGCNDLQDDSIVQSEQRIKNIRAMTSQLLLAPECFRSLENDLNEQKDLFYLVTNDLYSFINHQNDAAILHDDTDSQYNIKQSMECIQKYIQNYVVEGVQNKIQRTERTIKTRRAGDCERQKLTKRSKKNLIQVKKIIKSTHTQTTNKNSADFHLVNAYCEENAAFNNIKMKQDCIANVNMNPYHLAANVMSNIDRLFQNTSHFLQGATEQLCLVEYVLSYFKCIHDLQDKCVKQNNKVVETSQYTADGKEGEIEYILYGMPSIKQNVALAYQQIFEIRLAIRMVEGLLENKHTCNPLLILCTAIAYGIEHAIADTKKLKNGNCVSLCKYIKKDLNYKDHLRLFLLMEQNNSVKMSRIAALIRANIGVNINVMYTYVVAQTRGSIKLWFLPGIIKCVGVLWRSSYQVNKNRFYISNISHYSY